MLIFIYTKKYLLSQQTRLFRWVTFCCIEQYTMIYSIHYVIQVLYSVHSRQYSTCILVECIESISVVLYLEKNRKNKKKIIFPATTSSSKILKNYVGRRHSLLGLLEWKPKSRVEIFGDFCRLRYLYASTEPEYLDLFWNDGLLLNHVRTTC